MCYNHDHMLLGNTLWRVSLKFSAAVITTLIGLCSNFYTESIENLDRLIDQSIDLDRYFVRIISAEPIAQCYTLQSYVIDWLIDWLGQIRVRSVSAPNGHTSRDCALSVTLWQCEDFICCWWISSTIIRRQLLVSVCGLSFMGEHSRIISMTERKRMRLFKATVKCRRFLDRWCFGVRE